MIQGSFFMEENEMKRSNGEGTIYKRNDGRWCAAFYDDSPHPKRHFVYGSTQAEVKQKLKEKRENTEIENKKKDNMYTLGTWMSYFLENYKKIEVKETTYGTYQELYRKHIIGSVIEKTRLERIDSNQLQKFYNEKRAEDYNPKTIRHIHVLINSALEKAVQLKLIKENPNRLVVLPKREQYKAKVLSVEEVARIVKEAKEEELYSIITLTIYTGLRKGEVMALKWENIDFDKKELFVEGSLCRVLHEPDENGKVSCEYKILAPKTEKSKRVIPLMDVAVEALLIQKKRQDEMKELCKDFYQDEGLVFSRYDGRHLDQRGFMNDYHAFLKRHKISDVRFHDLRHTFASLLLEIGESPKVIQELLGHSTITTTMDIYAHITKKGKIKAIANLDKIIDMGISEDD